MAHYKKRADGRYAAQIRTGNYKDDGRPEIITLYAKTEKELVRMITEKKYEIDHGLYVFDQATTLQEYAERWLDTAKANRSIQTKAMYANIIKNHLGDCAEKKIKDITQMDIQNQVNNYRSSPRTAQLVRLTYKQLIESAIVNNLIAKNVCVNIELPRSVKKEKRAFTKAETKAIKEADYSTMEKAYIMLLYGCGLRPAEAMALTWSDIDFKHKTIKICKSLNFDGYKPIVVAPKTNSGIRNIEAPDLTINALKEYRKECKDIVLFGKDGNYLHKSEYNTLFKHCKDKITEKLGYDSGFTAYFFRHNYCTLLYYSHVSLKECIRLMGHSDSAMIMKVYAHLDAQQENTRSKIDAINF